jgi:hypothetical protein
LSKYWLNFKSSNNIVKGNFAFENSPGFQVQIDDLHLKWCILERNAKNNITGSNAFLVIFTHGVKGTSSNGT